MRSSRGRFSGSNLDAGTGAESAREESAAGLDAEFDEDLAGGIGETWRAGTIGVDRLSGSPRPTVVPTLVLDLVATEEEAPPALEAGGVFEATVAGSVESRSRSTRFQCVSPARRKSSSL